MQRFISPDTKFINGNALTGTNMYAFAEWNPLSYINNPIGKGVFEVDFTGQKVNKDALPGGKGAGIVIDAVLLAESARAYQEAKEAAAAREVAKLQKTTT